MKRNNAIVYGVAGILLSIIAIVALSAFNRLADLWLAPVMVLSGAVVELVKAAVEIAKATHRPMLDDDDQDKPDEH